MKNTQRNLLIVFLIFMHSLNSSTQVENIKPLKDSLILTCYETVGFFILAKLLKPLVELIRIKRARPLSTEESQYCIKLLSQYSYDNLKIKLLKHANNSKFAYALPSQNTIVLSSDYFKEDNFYKEYILLHEIGHLLKNKKSNINLFFKVVCTFFTFNLIFPELEKKNLTTKQFYTYVSTYFLSWLFIIKDHIVYAENLADKYALEYIKYNNINDYYLLKKYFEAELMIFNKKIKFLANLRDSHFIKRLIWYFYDNYIFPPDAIRIIDYKIKLAQI